MIIGHPLFLQKKITKLASFSSKSVALQAVLSASLSETETSRCIGTSSAGIENRRS